MDDDAQSALPGLIDQAGIRRELGVTEASAESIMRQVPVVRIPGLRRRFVMRRDVLALIERGTVMAEAI